MNQTVYTNTRQAERLNETNHGRTCASKTYVVPQNLIAKVRKKRRKLKGGRRAVLEEVEQGIDGETAEEINAVAT